MTSNVEMKCRITNLTETLKLADQLSDSGVEKLNQKDTYFNVPANSKNLRMKLREFPGQKTTAELISYARPDNGDLKFCDYKKSVVSDVQTLKGTLEFGLGVKGVVEKERQLFISKQTRIHIDHVKGLGDFLELEVALKQNQTYEVGKIIAKNIMEILHVSQDDILSTSYIDMLGL